MRTTNGQYFSFAAYSLILTAVAAKALGGPEYLDIDASRGRYSLRLDLELVGDFLAIAVANKQLGTLRLALD